MPIDLIVRGICCLRPGVSGHSDTIRVRSIVGRYLEHSRILLFENGGARQVFVSSADWMPRNFDRRVELVFPVEDERVKNRLVDEVLAASLLDSANVRLLRSDGTYERPQGMFNSHEVLEQVAAGSRTIFALPSREPQPGRLPAATP